jgi:DNA-binding NtrC family response regulator
VTERATHAVEKTKLMQTMEECRWNKMKAAERLQISYKTLLNKIHAYGLD